MAEGEAGSAPAAAPAGTRAEFRVRVVSDGTPFGTHIVDVDTGAKLRGVTGIKWEVRADNDAPARHVIDIDLAQIEFEGNVHVFREWRATPLGTPEPLEMQNNRFPRDFFNYQECLRPADTWRPEDGTVLWYAPRNDGALHFEHVGNPGGVVDLYSAHYTHWLPLPRPSYVLSGGDVPDVHKLPAVAR